MWSIFHSRVLECPSCKRKGVSVLTHDIGGKTFLICWECQAVFDGYPGALKQIIPEKELE